MEQPKIIIVGGGIIGLSIGEHLLRRGARPILIDKGPFAREASWAGAGYVDLRDAARIGGDFLELCRFSYGLFPGWTQRLKEESGVDPEFIPSGGMGLMFDPQDESTIREMHEKTSANGLKGEWLSSAEARQREPALSEQLGAAWFLSQTCQVRPPRLNQALLKVLEKGGAVLKPNEEVRGFVRQGDRILGVQTSGGTIEADQVVLATGAWTGEVAKILGLSLPVKPIRGQVVLFKAEPDLLKHVLFSSSAYLVPRRDGRIYVGSTLEDAGFDKSTVGEALERLKQGAIRAVPALKDAVVEGSWSGLRPKAMDDWPILGLLPGFKNLWAASGHYTHGILLSAATGHLMSQAILGEKPAMNLSPFSTDRKPHFSVI